MPIFAYKRPCWYHDFLGKNGQMGLTSAKWNGDLKRHLTRKEGRFLLDVEVPVVVDCKSWRVGYCHVSRYLSVVENTAKVYVILLEL